MRTSGGQLADRLLVAGGGGGGGFTGSGTQGGAGGNPTGGTGTSGNGPGGTGGTQAAGGSSGGSMGTGGGGNSYAGGAGGGGYYGGGGGGLGGAGGGGSSWVTPTSSSGLTLTAGYNAGNGSLSISPALVYAAPVFNGANIINVPGTWSVSGGDVYRPTGNVGIGTSSPGQKLEVAGGIKFTGTGSVLTFPDGTTQATAAAGDNLGNHTATQALNLQGNALTGTGSSISGVGVGVRADGGLNLGQGTSGNSIYLGYQAGRVNMGNQNLFSGYQSGLSNTTGGGNVFGGYQSGYQNTTGGNNTFNGTYSGYSNTAGGSNTFSGNASGYGNTTGGGNAFSGGNSGQYNTTGSNNTALGYSSGPQNGKGDITNATALGANVLLTTSNTVILGNNANVGIGTPNPGQKLDVAGNANVSGNAYVNGALGVVLNQQNQPLITRGWDAFTSGNYQGAGRWGLFMESGTLTFGVPAAAGKNFQWVTYDATSAINTNLMFLNQSGQLGIGTTGPATTLDVRTADASAAITVGKTDASAGALYFGNPNHGLKRNYNGGNDVGLFTTSGTLYLSAAGNASTSQFVLQNGGNVGIGTPTPSQKLEVAGQVFSSSGGFRFPDNTVQATAAVIPTGANFIQNQTSQQASANFNVSGNGTVGGTLAATNASITTALTGNGASIGGVGVGVRADGGLNLGQNTSGNSIYLGYQAGRVNTGSYNTFSGYQSGYSNTTSSQNTFSGYQSGYSNTTGGNNTFSGNASGYGNTTGGSNAFSGGNSGQYNTTGSNNTALGYGSGPQSGKGDITNATALGALVKLTTSNTVVLGNMANVGIGTTSPSHPLVVQTNTNSGDLLGFNNGAGVDKYSFSLSNGGLNLSESNVAAGRLFIQDGGNVGIGTTSPSAGLHIDEPESAPRGGLGVMLSGGTSGNPSIELRGANKGGNNATPYIDFTEYGDLDYTTRLISQDGVLNLMGGGNGSGHLLFRVNNGMQAAYYDNISDARFKTNVRPIGSALASVLALRGVRYEWNALGVAHGGAAHDGQVGLLAQELEKVYPELVHTDAEGYKSVNYAQLTPVLIEAIKELAAQNEALKQEASTAKAAAGRAQAQAAQATATLETFEARLRRLEAGTGQAQR